MSLGTVPPWVLGHLLRLLEPVVDLVVAARARDQRAVDDASATLVERAAELRERARFPEG